MTAATSSTRPCTNHASVRPSPRHGASSRTGRARDRPRDCGARDPPPRTSMHLAGRYAAAGAWHASCCTPTCIPRRAPTRSTMPSIPSAPLHRRRLAGRRPAAGGVLGGAAGGARDRIAARGRPITLHVVSESALAAQLRTLDDRTEALTASPAPADAAAARRALRRQGQYRHRRRTDHRRLPRLCLRGARSANCGAAPARRRRGLAGEDQPRSVRHRPRGHPFALWRAGQHLGRDACQRRLELGLGGRRGARRVAAGPGHRHRRLRRRAGRLQPIVGLKPTGGRIGTAGVVPACRSIDCVSYSRSPSTTPRARWPSSRVPTPPTL